MSDALLARRGGWRRRVAGGVAAGAVALVALLAVLGLAGGPAVAAPSPTPTRLAVSSSPRASVLVTTTRSTVHAAGSTVPAWGLVFLVAVFVVAVAIALPATRRGTPRSSA